MYEKIKPRNLYIHAVSQRKNIQDLDIDIAQWSRKRVHQLRNRQRLRIDAQIHDILQSTITTRRVVVQRDSAANRILSVLDILHLPQPPSAVNLCMVHVESWVTRRGEDVARGISAHDEVPCGVHAVEAGGKVALHDGLEGVDVVVGGDEREGVGVFGPPG